MPAPSFEVTPEEIDDLKSVYATVRSKDLIEARVRTPGTIASLKVDEGDSVEPGQVLALVADPKIALKIKALDAQIVAIESRLETAKTELERVARRSRPGALRRRRASIRRRPPTTWLRNDLKAAQAERSVVETQIEEGAGAGAGGRPRAQGPGHRRQRRDAGRKHRHHRRQRVPVAPGAARAACPVHQGGRSGPPRRARPRRRTRQPLAEGRITQVYPEIEDGRVVADAEVAGLGDYFVGERVLVWISAGKRNAIVVPRDFVFTRFGLDYVRLATARRQRCRRRRAARPTRCRGRSRPTASRSCPASQAGDRLVQP